MPNDARNRRGPRRARPEPAPPPEPAPRARNAPPLRLIGLAAMIAGVLAAMPWPVDRKPRPQQGAQPQRAPAALPFDTVAPCEPTLPVAVELAPDAAGRRTWLEAELGLHLAFASEQAPIVRDAVLARHDAARLAAEACLAGCTRKQVLAPATIEPQLTAALQRALFPDGLGRVERVAWLALRIR